MNSKQIECFLVVAEYLSFTDAGKRLFTSQSTVSRQIVLLEEELGFELFVRGNNYVRLTPAGAIMIPAFKQVSEIIAYQKKLAMYTTLGKSGAINIGFLTNMNINKFCINYLEEFRDKYPEIVINYRCFPDGNYEQALQDNEIDLIFTHDFDSLNSINFISNSICTTNMQILYSIKHPAAYKGNLSFYDFQNDVFWTNENSNTDSRKELIQIVSDYYKVPLIKTATAPNFDTILLNIGMGNGVAFIDELTLSSLPEDYRTFPLDKEISEIRINLVWNRKNLNPSIPLFVNMILKAEE